MLPDMSLSHRVDQFQTIISNTICTNIDNQKLDTEYALKQVMHFLLLLRSNKKPVYIIGNGGSAAVASHALVDFVNVAKLNVHVLHESALLTCLANDYGYDNAYAQALSTYLQPEDLLIAISSSGKSPNILKGANIAVKKRTTLITFTGFDSSNPLRQLGHFNFWLNSKDYGYVEMGHQFILHNLADRFGVQQNILIAAETDSVM